LRLPVRLRRWIAHISSRTWYTIAIAHTKGGVGKTSTTWYFRREFTLPQSGMSRRALLRPEAGSAQHNNQPVLCLTRRRVDVLHAMLRRGVPYRSPAPLAAAA